MSKSGISDVVTLFRCGLFILMILTSLLVQADRLPLPLFVPVLVHQSLPLQVRTLSSYEMTTSLRLTPDPAPSQDLEAQMHWQYLKLRRLMPIRAEKIWEQWQDLSKDLEEIQMDLSLPPGMDWNEWAKPHGEDLRPVAVVNFSMDGRRLFYIDKVLFPALTVSDQAQVLWQLLWTTELGSDDNLKIRTITNYLFSKEWRDLDIRKAFSLFKKFEFDYLEDQGFCFQNDNLLHLHASGHVQSGMASEKCVITYDDQDVILMGKLELSEEGRIISRFLVSEETPWTVFWEGHYLKFFSIEHYPDKGLKLGGVPDTFPKRCANQDGPIVVQTGYAELDFDCLNEIQFFPNGVIDRVSNAEAVVPVRGKIFRVGKKQALNGSSVGRISFYDTGAIRGALFPIGASLESVDGRKTELKIERSVILNEDGFLLF